MNGKRASGPAPRHTVADSIRGWWGQPARDRLFDLVLVALVGLTVAVAVLVWRTAIEPPYTIRVVLPTVTAAPSPTAAAPSPTATAAPSPTPTATKRK